jgi:hypothetical protein
LASTPLPGFFFFLILVLLAAMLAMRCPSEVSLHTVTSPLSFPLQR